MGVVDKRKRAEFLWANGLQHYVGGTILDIGVGASANMYGTAFARGFSPDKYWGVDVVKENLDKIESLGGHPIYMDLESGDFPKGLKKKIDVVVCAEVLEHLTERGEDNVIGIMREVTHPGSRICITFPEHALAKGFAKSGHIRQPDPDAVINKILRFASNADKSKCFKYNGLNFGSHVIVVEV